jgi:hypothetical protein
MSIGRRRRPALESLEDRCLLSATLLHTGLALDSRSMGGHQVAARKGHHHPQGPIIPNLGGATKQALSTIPGNGDLNPYGVTFIPQGFHGKGALRAGDILVSNFNNGTNVQGTGTTIVRFDAAGHQSLFFQGQPGLGLTAALGTLKAGFVVVGNLPDPDGTAATIQPGSLLILNSRGQMVTTISGPSVDGPWGLAVNDRGSHAELFVSNALNGTVVRIDLVIRHGAPVVRSETQIGSGYTHSLANNVIVGPAGLAYDAATDTLFVADQGADAVWAIAHARKAGPAQGPGNLVIQDTVHFHGPLDLGLLPNGDLFSAQSDSVTADPKQPSELVEFTRQGQFVGQFSLDPNNGGAFGAALESTGHQLRIAAVDDNNSIPNKTTPNPGPGLFVWTFREVHGNPVIPGI